MGLSFLGRAARAVTGFSLSTLVTGVVSVLAVPAVIAAAGEPGWASVAIGQAAGALAGIFVGWGWVITGPATVGAMERNQAVQAYRDSVIVRSVIFVVACPFIVIACVLLAGSGAVVASLVGVSTALIAVGGGWYFIGRRAPTHLLFFESMPRAAFTCAGIILLIAGAPLIAFALAQLLGSLVAVVLAANRVVKGEPRQRDQWSPRRLSGVLRGQAHGSVTAISSGAFISLPTLVVAAVAPGALAAYALADRIQKLANMGLMPIGQVFQGWVPSAPKNHLLLRVRRAAMVAVAIGGLSGTALAIAMPWAADVLSNGEIEVGLSLSVPFGIVLWCSMTTQVTGLACLAALGRSRLIMNSALVGAAVGVLAMVVFVPLFGGVGAVWSVVAGESAVMIFQAICLFFIVRRGYAEPSAHGER